MRSKTSTIPKAHYDVFYNSNFFENGSITLDVLFEENPYPVISDKKIMNNWIKTSEPYQTVKIPDIDSILGDKLTAYAPTTIGVPYLRGSNSMSTEIIKQLFDISNLIDKTENIANIFKSFENTTKNQLEYRELSISLEDVYKDIFNTSLIIAKKEKNKGGMDTTYYNYLHEGIKNINYFLSTGFFRDDEATIASAKATWITSIFKTQEFNAFVRYNKAMNNTDLIIINLDFNFLNKLKRYNPEAFYYWYKTLEILNLLNEPI